MSGITGVEKNFFGRIRFLVITGSERIMKFLRQNFGFLVILLVIAFLNYKYDFYVIRTGSMEPTIKVGAVVMVDPQDTPEAGEIGAYLSGTSVVIHRVLTINDTGFEFKGDANPSPDPMTVPHEDVKGTVVLRFNFISRFVVLIQNIMN